MKRETRRLNGAICKERERMCKKGSFREEMERGNRNEYRTRLRVEESEKKEGKL